MVILLMIINGYFINGYWWLLYGKLLLVILCYITIIRDYLLQVIIGYFRLYYHRLF
jgi:hypothetical protein